MATQRFMVRLKPTSGIPADAFVNTYYFDVNAPDTVEGACDELAAAYDALLFTAGWTGIEIRVYDLAGGQPTFRKEYVTASTSSASAPFEVSVCLSYAAVDDVESSTARRRGRVYLGPWVTAEGGKGRPSDALIDTVLDFGELLGSIGTASNTTWHMYSQLDSTSAKIEAIWCDDAWDIQRRRGVLPSKRVVRDVQ